MNPKIHRCFSFCFAESELIIPFVTTQPMALLRRKVPINYGWSTYIYIASIRKENALLFPLILRAFSENEPPFWRRISAGCLTGHGQNEAWLPGCPTDQNGRTLLQTILNSIIRSLGVFHTSASSQPRSGASFRRASKSFLSMWFSFPVRCVFV